jgi:hypothetical protein
MPQELSLDQLVEILERYRVRATYGAVSGYLGQNATFLMNGIERAPKYSWIVNKATSEPTGYSVDEIHPDLRRNNMVLGDVTELRQWLRRKADQAARSGIRP